MGTLCPLLRASAKWKTDEQTVLAVVPKGLPLLEIREDLTDQLAHNCQYSRVNVPLDNPFTTGPRRKPRRRRRRLGCRERASPAGGGRTRPGLPSPETRPAAELGVGSPILPARRPPRRLHRAVAACSPPRVRARGHWSLGRSRPLSSAPFPSFSPPAARLELGAPPPPPHSRTRSSRGRRLRGGRGAARLPGPGARVARDPPAPRGDSQCSAPRPDSAGSARRAGGPEDAGGLPRPRPALPSGRAPGAPLAAPPPPPPPPPPPARGREGGVRPRREPQPQGGRSPVSQPQPPPSSCRRAPADAEGQPRASPCRIPGLTAGVGGCSRSGQGPGTRALVGRRRGPRAC
ncbi:proline-rich protein HaeIII subfamily 1-like [Enhydra lutris kenyoni]|uniref:Proline-rich protein HaeIII subfamily 1-like n=1 Tax=Enhydra lutris kenyoni TaxID=391180 RepID=A0A2Y9KIH1_ENHLU|nr:proline-rich protein HaeIII subfamily 1-like [Enhydra lutris kenyoni]